MNRRISRIGWLAIAVGAGAAAAFFLDPVSGRRRRAMAKDKALHYQLALSRLLSRRLHDLDNRAHGLAYKLGLWDGDATKAITKTITRTNGDDEKQNLGPTARHAAEKGTEYIH